MPAQEVDFRHADASCQRCAIEPPRSRHTLTFRLLLIRLLFPLGHGFSSMLFSRQAFRRRRLFPGHAFLGRERHFHIDYYFSFHRINAIAGLLRRRFSRTLRCVLYIYRFDCDLRTVY